MLLKGEYERLLLRILPNRTDQGFGHRLIAAQSCSQALYKLLCEFWTPQKRVPPGMHI